MRASLWGVFFAIMLTACGCYTHRYPAPPVQPNGCPMPVDNVYTDPTYEHSHVLNVLLLPVDDPLCSEDFSLHYDQFVHGVLRAFGKHKYFQLQYASDLYERVDGPVIDTRTGYIDRVVLGALGTEYNVQAVLKLRVDEFRPYPPMRMQVKAMLIDIETGQRIWDFDHVFDSEDNDVVNSMRIWWNTHLAGGDRRNRFTLASTRPSVFTNFVFYTMAQSYGRNRIENAAAIQRLKAEDEAAECRLEKERQQAYTAEPEELYYPTENCDGEQY